MDSLLRELFGAEPEAPAAQPAAAESTGTATAKPTDAEREARREARQRRKADPEARHKRKEFVDRYTTGHPSEGFTAEEAVTHLREMREEMTPAEFRKAMERTLENLPADQRDEFTALMRQHKAAKATAAAAPAAAGAAKAADPFGGLLTGLLGGGAAATGSAPGVGDVLNDLAKGGLKAPTGQAGGAPSEADLAALLNSPLGRAVLGGVAAYGMQAMQADDDDHDTPGGTRSRR